MASDNIYNRLKADHDQHRALLKDIEAAFDDRDRLIDLIAHFRVEVTAHAAAEEESLYATMLANPDLREEAQHSVAEHKRIDDRLQEMEGLSVGSEEWRGKFKDLRHCYLHHIDEEEDEMFPAADEELSSAKERELAETFEERKPKELERALKE